VLGICFFSFENFCYKRTYSNSFEKGTAMTTPNGTPPSAGMAKLLSLQQPAAQLLPSGDGIFYPNVPNCLSLMITVKGDEAIKIAQAIDKTMKRFEIPYPVQGYLNVGLNETVHIGLRLKCDGTNFEITNNLSIHPIDYKQEHIGPDSPDRYRRLTAVADHRQDHTGCYAYDYEDGESKRTLSEILQRNTKIPHIDPHQLIAQVILENLPPHMKAATDRLIQFDRFGYPRMSRPAGGRFSVLNPSALKL
jgi:hypothetical protein